MSDELDTYFSRCLKNWTAKFHPPSDGKARLLRKASLPDLQEPSPFLQFLSSFLNRAASSHDLFYSQRHWQMVGPFTQSLVWTFHLETYHRVAN